jgi:hypothetical protein
LGVSLSPACYATKLRYRKKIKGHPPSSEGHLVNRKFKCAGKNGTTMTLPAQTGNPLVFLPYQLAVAAQKSGKAMSKRNGDVKQRNQLCREN